MRNELAQSAGISVRFQRRREVFGDSVVSNGLFACKMIRKYSSNQLLSNMSRESKSLEKWKIFSRNSITLTLIFSLTNIDEYFLNVSCFFFFFYTKLDDKSKVILSNRFVFVIETWEVVKWIIKLKCKCYYPFISFFWKEHRDNTCVYANFSEYSSKLLNDISLQNNTWKISNL